MKLYCSLFISIMKQNFKKSLSYPIPFITEFISDILIAALGIVYIEVIFSKIPDINGWSRAQVLLIYCFAELSIGITTAVFGGIIFNFSNEYIIKGGLDQVLIKPIKPYFQVLISKANFPIYGNDIFLIGYLIFVFIKYKIAINAFGVLLLLMLLISSILIYISVFGLVNSLCFFMKSKEGYWLPIWHMATLSKYPTTIYSKLIQYFLTYIIPLSFVAFYPIKFFLGRFEHPGNLVLIPVGSFVFFYISYVVWNLGLHKYESSGY